MKDKWPWTKDPWDYVIAVIVIGLLIWLALGLEFGSDSTGWYGTHRMP